MKKIMSGISILFMVLVFFLVGCAKDNTPTNVAPENNVSKNPIVIGVLFSDLQIGRWQTDRDLIIDEAKKSGASVVVASADLDADKQLVQAKSMIMQGVNILIVVAQDADKAGAIVDEAHKAGIKVIAYDRLIKNADLDYYMTFDNIKVGEYEAQGVMNAMANGKGNVAYVGGSPTDNNAYLVREGSFNVMKPKIDSGDIKIVMDGFTDSWDQKLAYQKISDYLDKNNTLDGIVVANDGMAAGVIQALEEHGLAGKIPVSGQDAELNACKYIISGKQTVTVYKPLKKLASEAAKTAVAIAKGKKVNSNAVVNNGKKDVPSILLDVVMVTKANINDTIIKEGFYSHEDLYGSK